jgi:hypothetical protein
VKDVTRELSGWMWLEHLGQDLRFAMQQIDRAPGFSLAVILTLALGIGVNSAVFSMVNGFMLRPLPYPDADRLRRSYLPSHSASPLFQRRYGASGVQEHDEAGNTYKEKRPQHRAHCLRTMKLNQKRNLTTNC